MLEGEPAVNVGGLAAMQEYLVNDRASSIKWHRIYRWVPQRAGYEAALVDTASQEWRDFQRQGRTRLEHEMTEPGQTVIFGHDPATGFDWTTTSTYHIEPICMGPSVRITGVVPARPSDAEIVSVYIWEMGAVEDVLAGRPKRPLPPNTIQEGGHWFVRDQYVDRTMFAPAWSRELKRLADEAREKERQRVVCEGTLAEDF